MSKITFDLHTHTTHSHGKGSAEDNVKTAIKKGLKKIAITDHGTRHVSYGIRDLDAYFKDIFALKEKYADKIEILSGIEFNLCSLDGKCEDYSAYTDKLDIKLLGYHKFTAMKDAKSYFYCYLTKKRDIVKNTDAVVSALYKNDIDILTHPGYAMPIDIREVARACAERNTLFEINEKHSDLTSNDIYLAAGEGARFIISSDAHSPQNVANTPNALNKFLKAGVDLSLAVNIEE